MMDDGNVDEASSSSFQDLYRALLFLISLLLAGDFLCGKLLRIVPSLVGQIAVGIVFGPYVLNWIPLEWQTLGEIGLVLLLAQAGLEMDFETLTKIGVRGGIMAIVGSILPMTIGFLLSYFVLDLTWQSAIAAGASFGPTSAGIAMNVLEQCGVLRSQVGQLIVAIAIVDDIFALVVLSQLRALTGDEITTSSIVIPIVSALLWLVIGGYTALYVMPKVFVRLNNCEQKLFGHKRQDKAEEGSHDDRSDSISSSSLWHIGILLFALLPATYYSQASYLLGAFLAGLSACQESDATASYNQQLAQIIQWLMRIFFGASIAFEIPILLFNDSTVIGQGFLLSLSLLGKIITGPLLTPILHDNTDEDAGGRRRWDRDHLRDCAIVGFSMAGEAEFAFVVAAFGLEEGLLTEQVYASVVFAILLSTIVSPVLLRTTLAIFPIPSKSQGRPGGDGTAIRSENVDMDESNTKETANPEKQQESELDLTGELDA